jgi:hypothetical protein
MMRRLIMVIVVTLVLSLTYGRSAGIHGPAHAQEVNPDSYPPTTDPSTIDWAAIPAPDLGTPATERPVLFIHGLDAWDDLAGTASVDCYTSWDKMADKLHALGWDTNRTKFRYIGNVPGSGVKGGC